jgi:hypothetical protein
MDAPGAVGATGVGLAVTVTEDVSGAHPVVASETATVYVAAVFTDIDCVTSPFGDHK